jgi:hypothetical protein
MVAPKKDQLEFEIPDPLGPMQEEVDGIAKDAAELQKSPNPEKKAALLMKAEVFRVALTAIRGRAVKLELDALRLVNLLKKMK